MIPRDQARRALLLRGAACVIASVPALGGAQEKPRKKIAIFGLLNLDKKYWIEEFSRHGLVDGRDIEIVVVKPESADWILSGDGIRAYARQVTALRPALMLTHMDGPSAESLLLPLIGDTPLVLFGVDDGSDSSIEALNRSKRNVTGVMYLYIQLVGKRFEMLKTLVPKARRAALVAPPSPLASDRRMEEIVAQVNERDRAQFRAMADKLGIEYISVRLPRRSAPAAIVAALREQRIDIAEIHNQLVTEGLWDALADNGIAASGIQKAAENGALLAGWSTGFVEETVRLAARVARGAPASTIPVERSTRFGYAINLRTARKLGITVPASLLVGADRLYE